MHFAKATIGVLCLLYSTMKSFPNFPTCVRFSPHVTSPRSIWLREKHHLYAPEAPALSFSEGFSPFFLQPMTRIALHKQAGSLSSVPCLFFALTGCRYSINIFWKTFIWSYLCIYLESQPQSHNHVKKLEMPFRICSNKFSSLDEI